MVIYSRYNAFAVAYITYITVSFRSCCHRLDLYCVGRSITMGARGSQAPALFLTVCFSNVHFLALKP